MCLGAFYGVSMSLQSSIPSVLHFGSACSQSGQAEEMLAWRGSLLPTATCTISINFFDFLFALLHFPVFDELFHLRPLLGWSALPRGGPLIPANGAYLLTPDSYRGWLEFVGTC